MQTNGIVFNIQKFSIHDGPGIRTTVFLKGCPLRCKWCANPESQLSQVQILYDKEKCAHCGTCTHVCPNQAISMGDDSYVGIDPSKCAGCLQCVKNCPAKALSYEGEAKDVDEVVKVCLQDIDFYEESGGGVTISGGEGMVQPDFVKALLAKLKEHKIHSSASDVFTSEPPQGEDWVQELLKMDNFIQTAHIASRSKEAEINTVNEATYQITELLK